MQIKKQKPSKIIYFIVPVLLVILAAAAIYRSSNISTQNLEKNKELYALKNNLIQTRVLMVQMLSINTENVLELNDIINLTALKSKETKELANNLKDKQTYSKHKKLIIKSHDLAYKIETNTANAMEKKTGSRKEAINLLVELTNLILEWDQKLPD